MLRVLGLIPARGGSKGVPRKNIRLLNGKPLLAYTAESALAASLLSRVVLSTEDNEIAKVGEELGLEVLQRAPILAEDTTPMLSVVLDAVRRVEQSGDFFDAVCLLQPTNPLRRSADIDSCIKLLDSSKADSVVSVLPVPHLYNPKWVYWGNTDGTIALSSGESEPVSRRQDLPSAFHRDGSVYVTRRDVLFEFGNLYGEKVLRYEMDERFSVNIDTLDDWHAAEQMLPAATLFRADTKSPSTDAGMVGNN